VVDVVGPVCESADVLAKRRWVHPLATGDLIVMRTAAPTDGDASQYNARPGRWKCWWTALVARDSRA